VSNWRKIKNIIACYVMLCCVEYGTIREEQAVCTQQQAASQQNIGVCLPNCTASHSHCLIYEDAAGCDNVSLGRLFLKIERILVPSKPELFAHQHVVTCLKTCIFSNCTVRTSNLTHRKLAAFRPLHELSLRTHYTCNIEMDTKQIQAINATGDSPNLP
jgi:hypothetical protein